MKIIKGKNVILRPRDVKDVDIIVKWYRDKNLMLHYGHEKYRVKALEVRKHILGLKKKDSLEKCYMIELLDGNVIGTAGYDINPHHKFVTLYIMIGGRDYQGKGYASETIKVLIDFIFKTKKFNRIELGVFIKNKRAFNLYKNIGFIKEGVCRQAGWNKITKQFDDMVIMSILRNEWLKKSSGGESRTV